LKDIGQAGVKVCLGIAKKIVQNSDVYDLKIQVEVNYEKVYDNLYILYFSFFS